VTVSDLYAERFDPVADAHDFDSRRDRDYLVYAFRESLRLRGAIYSRRREPEQHASHSERACVRLPGKKARSRLRRKACDVAGQARCRSSPCWQTRPRA
jgi:hypothetical protein